MRRTSKDYNHQIGDYMGKCKKGCKSVRERNKRLHDHIDAVCVYLDVMEPSCPSGKLTTEELDAARSGTLTGLSFALVALDDSDPICAMKVMDMSPRALAEQAMEIAAEAHLEKLKKG